MKILLFTNLPSPYFVEYANQLGKYADVLVVFERKKASNRDKSWEKVNAINFNYAFLKGINVGTEASLSFGAKKFIKKNKDRIIIFGNPTTPTGILGIRYCKRHKIPYCVQSEGGFARVGNDFKTKIKRYLFKDAALCLTGMTPSTDYFTAYGAPIEKVKQYPFASLAEKDLIVKPISLDEKVDIKKELNIPFSKMILYVGRIESNKGIDILLKAFADFDDEYCLYCVGGEPYEELNNIIAEKNIKNCFFVKHSDLETLKKYYKCSDVFVLPTRYDTWGLVVNEAMSYGLPVITTDNCVAGLQLIENGKNGYVVKTESVEELKDAINNAFLNSEINQMPKNNIEKIKNHTYETMAKVIFGHLSELNTNGQQ